MGPILAKPVTTKVLERKSTPLFHVGLAYMNGFRERMEDAHTVYHENDWGFFGVFDGHCGSDCSEYVAKRFPEVIKGRTMPISEADIQKISLEIDKEFLSGGTDGGSTGTFMFSQRVNETYELIVGNVGDSRVILGRRANGECVSLTDDHKPLLPEERARIEAAGGHVSNNRVDGSLAVSRAFGDGQYKNGDQLKSKVIALPEVKKTTAAVGDFVILCCDGVFENDAFTNEAVVEFVHECLQKKMDLASICAAVCDAAMDRGSKDNISAMVVQLGGELDCKEEQKEFEVLAGPYNNSSPNFLKAYSEMAKSGHLSCAQCVELRFDQVRQRLEARKRETGFENNACDLEKLSNDDLRQLVERSARNDTREVPHLDDRTAMITYLKNSSDPALVPQDILDMQAELQDMNVPEAIASKPQHSQERTAFFESHLEQRRTQPDEDVMQAKARDLQQRLGLNIPLHFFRDILEKQGPGG